MKKYRIILNNYKDNFENWYHYVSNNQIADISENLFREFNSLYQIGQTLIFNTRHRIYKILCNGEIIYTISVSGPYNFWSLYDKYDDLIYTDKYFNDIMVYLSKLDKLND